MTKGQISLKIGSIYPQLDQLEKDNFIIKQIESVSESTHMQKAVYTISKLGLAILQDMITEWEVYSKNISNFLV